MASKMFSKLGLLFALSTVVSAAPYEKINEDARGTWKRNTPWDDIGTAGTSEGVLQQLTSMGLNAYDFQPAPTLPLLALPPPTEGLELWHILLGRGTQNYTCDFSNATAVPTAAGAVADLYWIDESSKCSDLLAEVPTHMLNNMRFPRTERSPYERVGHHYFTGPTTPYFNLDIPGLSWGQGAFAKLNATNAPTDAPKGKKVLTNEQYGAVPYLKLVSADSSQCHFQEIYRVNTAGGQPPPTCAEYQASPLFKKFKSSSEFQIQYSAEYWFYAPSSPSSS